MKTKLLILCMFLFGIFSINYVEAETNDLKLLGQVIYLDQVMEDTEKSKN